MICLLRDYTQVNVFKQVGFLRLLKSCHLYL